MPCLINIPFHVLFKSMQCCHFYDVSFDMKLRVNEQSVCNLYELHSDNEHYATVGVLIDLINCRDGINDIDFFIKLL